MKQNLMALLICILTVVCVVMGSSLDSQKKELVELRQKYSTDVETFEARAIVYCNETMSGPVTEAVVDPE